MHIEKNICEALLATLLEIAGKTKDTKKALLDLQDMDIRKDQHPLLDKGKYKLPSGLYKLSPEMKQILCNFLHDVKLSDGYCNTPVLIFSANQVLNLLIMNLSGY